MFDYKKVAVEFVEKARERLKGKLLYVILYGSVAKNMETKESDIDVFVVVKNNKTKEELFEIAFEIEKERSSTILKACGSV